MPAYVRMLCTYCTIQAIGIYAIMSLEINWHKNLCYKIELSFLKQNPQTPNLILK